MGDKSNTAPSVQKTSHHQNAESQGTVEQGQQSGNGQSERESPEQSEATNSHSKQPIVAQPPPITAEEQEFLKSQGILPPKLPPMPDPIACASTSYGGRT